MRITEVAIHTCPPHTNPLLLGFAGVTIDGWFVVRGLRIVKLPNHRLIVAMPSRKVDPPEGSDGSPRHRHRDVAYPLHGRGREYIERVVLGAYLQSERHGWSLCVYDVDHLGRPSPQEESDDVNSTTICHPEPERMASA